MRFERAIRYVEQELRILREELVAGTSTRWLIVIDAMSRHFARRIENIMLIEMQRPRSTRTKTAAEWAQLNRGLPDYASPIHIIQAGNDYPGRLAFGDHWLSDGRFEFPMEQVFDVYQTVGGTPELHKNLLDRILATSDRAIRFAEKENIKVIFDRLDGVCGHSLGGLVVIDTRMSDTDRCRCLLELLGRELLEIQHRTALGSNNAQYLRAIEADCVAWIVHRRTGLEDGEPPTPIDVADCSLATLVDTLHRVQQVASIILKGLHREFCEDIPV